MKSMVSLILLLLSYCVIGFHSEALTLNDSDFPFMVFNSEQEKITHDNFLQELMASPYALYRQLCKSHKKNCNFPFPASGFALAKIEVLLREIISLNPTLVQAELILARLPVLKKHGLPYQLTKELITEVVFFLQNYYRSTNQLVSDDDVKNKYNKTQNYDRLFEFGPDVYNKGFVLFYLVGPLGIKFFNRIWHLPISPLEISLNPINCFDFSVGGPQAVISHDLVHHNTKSVSEWYKKREVLIQDLNTIVDTYRSSPDSAESVINAIELIRFSIHHERYSPDFSKESFKEELNSANYLVNFIVNRVRSGEFGAEYNVASLHEDLLKAIGILQQSLCTYIPERYSIRPY